MVKKDSPLTIRAAVDTYLDGEAKERFAVAKQLAMLDDEVLGLEHLKPAFEGHYDTRSSVAPEEEPRIRCSPQAKQIVRLVIPEVMQREGKDVANAALVRDALAEYERDWKHVSPSYRATVESYKARICTILYDPNAARDPMIFSRAFPEWLPEFAGTITGGSLYPMTRHMIESMLEDPLLARQVYFIALEDETYPRWLVSMARHLGERRKWIAA